MCRDGLSASRYSGSEAVLEKFRLTPGVTITLSPSGKEKLLQAALGLTASQAQRVFGKAIVTDGRLGDEDIDFVMREKKQLIRDIEALEFTEAAETPENVGGLGELKHWLNLREKAFSGEARSYGLPAPKGIALIGIPGTGKREKWFSCPAFPVLRVKNSTGRCSGWKFN